jgi:hypothetical protein
MTPVSNRYSVPVPSWAGSVAFCCHVGAYTAALEIREGRQSNPVAGVADTLNKSRIVRGNPASIRFAIERPGALFKSLVVVTEEEQPDDGCQG